ncbi:MAG: hypothetical protein V3U10_03175, partial [Bacteroidota bacterium]
MKYMQNGGYQKNPFMRLTLSLTLLFLAGFVVTNFALYFAKMDLTPASVLSYYRGSEEEFRPARTFQSLLEVTHFHLPMMALVILLLTHLVIFAPFSKAGKVTFILVAFLSGLFNEASSWLVRYVSEDFALLKVVSFLALQGSLLFLLISLGVYLWRWQSGEDSAGSDHNGLRIELRPQFATKAERTVHPKPTRPSRKRPDSVESRDEGRP